MKKKTRQLDEVYCLVLRSVIFQLNGLFCSLEERKEISCCLWLCICCLTSNAYYAAGLRFINEQIVDDVIWFEDFFLLVIDVIKRQELTLITDCSLLVDIQSSALLSSGY